MISPLSLNVKNFKNMGQWRMINSEQIQKQHIPVMSAEVLQYLVPNDTAYRVVDCTLGFGGHSAQILKKNSKVSLLGIDQDDNALLFATHLLKTISNKISIVKGKFSDVVRIMHDIGWKTADAFLFDLGVSSPQIDQATRGFSYRFHGPLDMRMDIKSTKTAASILNHASRNELIHIFREYGEIEKAWKLADAIIERRTQKPWFYTTELAQLCEKIFPVQRRRTLPSATLCFQALRIAVNNELEELEKTLESVIPALSIGGRIVVISYHSLEDRIAKNIFRRESTKCLCSPQLPVCLCNHKAVLKILTKKPIVSSLEEIENNIRARSAKMRVAEKVAF